MADREMIQEHEDYPNILDVIKRYGGNTKRQLIMELWDESGDGSTQAELACCSKSELLVMVVDQEFGGTCQ